MNTNLVDLDPSFFCLGSATLKIIEDVRMLAVRTIVPGNQFWQFATRSPQHRICKKLVLVVRKSQFAAYT